MKLILFYIFWIIALIIGVAQAEQSITDPKHLSANSCASARCHEEVFAQWKKSRHAKSSPIVDVLMREMYRELGADPQVEGATLNGQYPVCLTCHAPIAAQEGSTLLTKHNYSEGVSCLTCHTLVQLKESPPGQTLLGMDAYQVSSTHLQSPSGRYLDKHSDAKHPLPMAPNQWNLRTSRACLGCHGKFDNQAGVNLCSTGIESRDMGDPVTCQSCHMPKTDDSTDHSMRGGNSEGMVNRALVMTLEAQPQADNIALSVRIENMLPHGFPTGSPLRNAYLRLTLYNEKDEMLWSNFSTFPIDPAESPQSVFALELDNPRLPFRATKVLRDSRFTPRETRALHFTAKVTGAVLMRGEIYYHPITQALYEQYADKLSGDMLSPIVAAIAEQRL